MVLNASRLVILPEKFVAWYDEELGTAGCGGTSGTSELALAGAPMFWLLWVTGSESRVRSATDAYGFGGKQ
jgi:hypothetical protein